MVTRFLLSCFSFVLLPVALLGLLSGTAHAQEEADLPFLHDVNMNGFIEIVAFGDSITRGVGDFIRAGEEVFSTTPPSREAGYPLRIEQLLNLPVSNMGVPGERLSTQGLRRFVRLMQNQRPDFVIISGGSNDLFEGISEAQLLRSVQTMINIAIASGTVPVLATIPPSCCNSSEKNRFTRGYNTQYRTLASVNNIRLADIHRAYTNTCTNIENCNLLNRPEGTHPNVLGYDVAGEVVIGTLLGINIFLPDGPSLLEQALGLAPGSVRTKPDPNPIQEVRMSEFPEF